METSSISNSDLNLFFVDIGSGYVAQGSFMLQINRVLYVNQTCLHMSFLFFIFSERFYT